MCRGRLGFFRQQLVFGTNLKPSRPSGERWSSWVLACPCTMNRLGCGYGDRPTTELACEQVANSRLSGLGVCLPRGMRGWVDNILGGDWSPGRFTGQETPG